ncbi:GTP-binding protein [Streptomyces uncialis]|uniref:GTP-binding protein n=1 Tax=Streptomyces uncialis TaxID=1048205 RepID=UPI00380C94B1
MTAVTDHTDHTDGADGMTHAPRAAHGERAGEAGAAGEAEQGERRAGDTAERGEHADQSREAGHVGRTDGPERAKVSEDLGQSGQSGEPGEPEDLRRAEPVGSVGSAEPVGSAGSVGRHDGHSDQSDHPGHPDHLPGHGEHTRPEEDLGDTGDARGGDGAEDGGQAAAGSDGTRAGTHAGAGAGTAGYGSGGRGGSGAVDPGEPARAGSAERDSTVSPGKSPGTSPGKSPGTEAAAPSRTSLGTRFRTAAETPFTRARARREPGTDSGRVWDDGLIARRVTDADVATTTGTADHTAPHATAPQTATGVAGYDTELRGRLDALRELVGLSRARLDRATLAEAGRVLDEATARRRLSDRHTVVAVAGATGSGKSTLFNTLAGVNISDTGVRRPTTSSPIACTWTDGAAGLLDRLGVPGRLRRRPVSHAGGEAQLDGLVLIDLPDHDSASVVHREQVDRVLALVDAVIWVVDPEKYADAVLHERYLRPLAGHAEVMFVVLNQIDRLPGDAADQVLDDLRRLLDEDGIALGEYDEPGATVLALSALTGEGMDQLREALDQFLAERAAPARRIAADVDAAAARLRPVYAAARRPGLTERARDEFSDRLAEAVGASAAGDAAERAWRRHAGTACGTPWLRLWRWYESRRDPASVFPQPPAPVDEESTARQRVEQAVRTVADQAASGLPTPWAQAVREAAVRGASGLPEALDRLAIAAGASGRPPRPGWWPFAVLAQASMTVLQLVGALWLVGQIIGMMSPNLGVPVLLMVVGIVGGPLVEWLCRLAARGPARRYGTEAERRLREAAAGCGRAKVLDPVAAELLRYREVREQYLRVTGVVPVPLGAGG